MMNKDLKILIAEDDVLNMKLFRDILEAKMVNTICITEESQIFKEVLKNIPDLVLIDVGVRNFVNLDVIKKIKHNQNTCHIPCMVLTTLTKKEYHRKILRSGCETYMVKPFSIKEFLLRIQGMIPLEIEKRLSQDEQLFQQITRTH